MRLHHMFVSSYSVGALRVLFRSVCWADNFRWVLFLFVASYKPFQVTVSKDIARNVHRTLYKLVVRR